MSSLISIKFYDSYNSWHLKLEPAIISCSKMNFSNVVQVLVLANVALGIGLVHLMCGVDDVYTGSSVIIDLLYNFSCYCLQIVACKV